MIYLRPSKYPPNKSGAYMLFGLFCGLVWTWLCAEILLRI
jgi:hypothetical protein